MFAASVRTLGLGLIGVLIGFGDLGFKVYGLGLSGLWFEASDSREVGIGGIGVRRSGLSFGI